MSWAMKGLHLIFIALVLWRDTSGFGVWNTTSVVDWQAGRSNATWNQNFHFATPVQALELLSRKSANGNVDGGNSSSFSYTSEVQTAQQDSSFVQSSGGAAQGKPVLNAQGQATPMVQPQDNLMMTQSSRLYWFESLKPENCGTLLSQSWPQKGQNNGGFQRPSRFQFGGTANQTSGSQTQSSYQPSTTTQVQTGESIAQPESFGASASYPSQTSGMYSVVQGPLIASSSQMPGFHIQSSYQPGTTTQVQTGQSASTSQAQSSGASTLYQGISSGRYLTSLGHIIPSSSQSVVTTNQTSGSQTQSSYQPGTTTLLQTGQSASTSQALGSHGAAPSGHAKWYTIVQGQTIPSSQASGSQTQSSYQPSTTTLLQTGQPVLPQSQPSGASASYPSQTSVVYNIAQRPLTATLSEIPGFHIQSSYQPGTTTLLQTGQSASTSQAQSSGASTLYQGIRRNVTSLGHGFPYSTQSVVTANQTSGSHIQSSYQPGTTTLLQTGQSTPTSQAQSSGASTLYQGIRRNVTSLGHGFPYSTQSVVTANQTSGSQTQSSYQPGTTTLLQTGQSASTSQALGSHGAAPSGHAKWYTIVQGQTIPSSQASGSQTQSSYQPSTTTLLQTGQPVLPQSQPAGASAPYPSQTSGVYNIAQRPLTVTLSEIPGFHIQSSYQPGTTTQVQTGQSASTSQAQSSGASTLYQGISSGRYLTSLGHIIPSSSQSVVTTNQTSGSQTQSSYQPGTTTLLQTGQSASTSQALGSHGAAPSGHAKWYTIVQGQTIPSSQASGSQTQSSYQPGTTTQVQTGQSASTSQAQSSGASTLYPGIRRNVTSLGHGFPYSTQSVVTANQTSGSQTQSSYQPSTTTLLQTGRPVLPQSQPSGASASYPSQTSGVYNIAQRPLTATLSEIPGFHIQSSYQPGTTTQVQTGQSASTSQAQSSGASTLYQGISSGRYLTSLGHIIPSSSQSVVTTNQTSGSQTQSSYQPGTTTLLQTGQSAPTSQAQSSGASTLYQGIRRNVTSLGHGFPYSTQSVVTANQTSGSQTQSSYQPSTTTLLQTGRPVLPQSQPSGASASYPSQTSGVYNIAQRPLTATLSEIPGFHIQSSYQPGTTTLLQTGQSASTSQAQSSGASTLYQGIRRNVTSLGHGFPYSTQSVVTANQTSGSQTQSSYQPGTTTLLQTGQSASTSQALGSHGAAPSGHAKWYTIVQGQTIPSSQASGSQTQSSYQPSTTTLLQTGQPVLPQSQPSGASAPYPSQTSGVYNIAQRPLTATLSEIPGFHIQSSYQPGTTTLLQTGQSASTSQAQSSGASTLYQGIRRNVTSLGHGFPYSTQSVVTANQTSGSQTQSSYQPGTTTLLQTGQSASTSQALGSHGAAPSGHAKWYTIVQGQTIPSSQASGSQTQSSYQPSTTTLLQTGQPVLPQSQPSGASAPYPSQTSGVYNIAQRPLTATLSEIPGFHIQSSYQPGTTTLLQTGQSASTSQAQSSGASTLYQGIRRNVTSLGHGFPYSTQSVVTANQTSGSQTQSSYQPGTTTLLQTGLSASTSQAQSSGASTFYQGISSGRYLTSLGQSIPSSSHSVVTTNKISGLQDQSFQPDTTTNALVGQSASTSLAHGNFQAPNWHTITPPRFHNLLRNVSVSQSLSSDPQTRTINNILPFLNQSAGTSAMSQNNVQTPAFHTSTHFSPVPQTVATPPVSLPKPCRQTQCSMVESAIASIASSQTSPRVATSSQGTGSFAAVPIPGTSQNFAGIDFQGTLPVHDQYSSVCNFPFGFCNSPQGAANNKFVRSQSVQTHNL
ncbi:mucin-5AC-like [Ictalurus punctatus]|uniref:Mucin-5AC-like n=1 Tax=Ictalurus punctatus TaxID=7998 RepID=A0A9F7TPN2_ICTPU|nr:mucin-5AC-like [Ictalurus punctatus]